MEEQYWNRTKENDMKKEDFTIEGSTALKKAFVEEGGFITTAYFASYKYLSNLLSSSEEDNNKLFGTDTKESKHFVLPQQYNEALEYVKDFWKEEEKFDVGDWVIGWHDNWHNRRSVAWQIFSILTLNGVKFARPDDAARGNTELKNIRKATPEEIEQAQTKWINVSGQFHVEINSKGIFHEGEDIIREDITEFVEMITKFKNYVLVGHLVKVKEIIFSKTGCENYETKLSDWKKVWEEYKKIKVVE